MAVTAMTNWDTNKGAYYHRVFNDGISSYNQNRFVASFKIRRGCKYQFGISVTSEPTYDGIIVFWGDSSTVTTMITNCNSLSAAMTAGGGKYTTYNTSGHTLYAVSGAAVYDGVGDLTSTSAYWEASSLVGYNIYIYFISDGDNLAANGTDTDGTTLYTGPESYDVWIKEIPYAIATKPTNYVGTYNGTSQTFYTNSYSGSKNTASVSMSGTNSATDAGTYSCTYSLTNSNYQVWEDGSTSSVTCSHTINKATPKINLTQLQSSITIYCTSDAKSALSVDVDKTVNDLIHDIKPVVNALTWEFTNVSSLNDSNLKITYDWYYDSTGLVQFLKCIVPAGFAAGTYTLKMTAAYEETTNYYFASKDFEITLIIKPVEESSISLSAPTITQTTNFPAYSGTLSTSNVDDYYSASGPTSGTVSYTNGTSKTISGTPTYNWSVTSKSISANQTTSTKTISVNGSCYVTLEGYQSNSTSFTTLVQDADSVASTDYEVKISIGKTSFTAASSSTSLTGTITKKSTWVSGNTTSSTVSGGTWSVPSWTSKSGSTLSINANTATSSRSGSVTYSYGGASDSVTISQDADEIESSEPEYEYFASVTAIKSSFTAVGGSSTLEGNPQYRYREVHYWVSGDITGDTDSDWSNRYTGSGGSWSKSSSDTWVTLGTASGNNMPFSVSINHATDSRTCTITYTYNGVSDTVTISQDADTIESLTLTLTPSSIEYGETSTPTVKANWVSGDVSDVTNSATYTSGDTSVATITTA